jgi:subtilisin family serine protease
VIVAPGTNVPTVSIIGGSATYAPRKGTSFAAPIVSGAAAFVQYLLPDQRPADTIAMLLEGGDDVSSLWPGSNVRLNLARTLG